MSVPLSMAAKDPEKDVPVGDDGVTRKWSAELLVSLDWKRLVEIARAMAVNAGFQISATDLGMDGRAEFEMNARSSTGSHRALVRLTAWNQWSATAETVQDLSHRLKRSRLRNGILIAPGGFTQAGRNAAITAGVEAVDATTLAAQLNALPASMSDFFFDIGTAGDASTPSCPSCFGALTAVHDSGVASTDLESDGDLSYMTNDIVPDAIFARRVEILRHCEVHFLREVHAKDLVIHGMASGDFVCDGSVVLNPGSVLNGTVAARSVHVRPGAALNGETRILEGPLPTLSRSSIVTIWRCANPRGTPKCRSVKFLPH